MTNASLRGSDFRNAIMKNAVINNADWFNSFNIERKELQAIYGDILKCPTPYSDPTFKAFIEYVNNNYGIKYDNYANGHKHDLQD